jgi:diacylglycerol kinase (ATP)
VLGRAAYPLTASALLPRPRLSAARLRVDDQVHELDTHQPNIANGSHHAGRAVAPDTGLDDRLLVVYRLGDSNRLRLAAATLRQTVTGPRRPLARAPFLTTRELWLETDPPMDLDIDGEIHGRSPEVQTGYCRSPTHSAARTSNAGCFPAVA